MDQQVYVTHKRLKAFPPVQMLYIIYRRLTEQGLRPTWLWAYDKILCLLYGFSPPANSRVTEYLYVGGQPYRHGLARMRALGIGAIVNLRRESDDARRGVALDAYLWLPTTDDEPPAMETLARGVAFIAAQIAAGRGVYIHCAAGVGRAPTLAAAYLVSTGLDPDAAWAVVRRGRPFVRPTTPQLESTRQFVGFYQDYN